MSAFKNIASILLSPCHLDDVWFKAHNLYQKDQIDTDI
jgi:hypothetical protein